MSPHHGALHAGASGTATGPETGRACPGRRPVGAGRSATGAVSGLRASSPPGRRQGLALGQAGCGAPARALLVDDAGGGRSQSFRLPVGVQPCPSDLVHASDRQSEGVFGAGPLRPMRARLAMSDAADPDDVGFSTGLDHSTTSRNGWPSEAGARAERECTPSTAARRAREAESVGRTPGSSTFCVHAVVSNVRAYRGGHRDNRRAAGPPPREAPHQPSAAAACPAVAPAVAPAVVQPACSQRAANRTARRPPPGRSVTDRRRPWQLAGHASCSTIAGPARCGPPLPGRCPQMLPCRLRSVLRTLP